MNIAQYSTRAQCGFHPGGSQKKLSLAMVVLAAFQTYALVSTVRLLTMSWLLVSL